MTHKGARTKDYAKNRGRQGEFGGAKWDGREADGLIKYWARIVLTASAAKE